LKSLNIFAKLGIPYSGNLDILVTSKLYIASLLPLTEIHQAQELAEYKRQWLALRRLRGKKAYTISRLGMFMPFMQDFQMPCLIARGYTF
jgi:hypothetical protein